MVFRAQSIEKLIFTKLILEILEKFEKIDFSKKPSIFFQNWQFSIK
jgi:hypothetical protein